MYEGGSGGRRRKREYVHYAIAILPQSFYRLTYNSAPYINMIIICGCIMVMVACILLGIDSGTPQTTDVPRDNILLNLSNSLMSRYSSICTVCDSIFIGKCIIIVSLSPSDEALVADRGVHSLIWCSVR